MSKNAINKEERFEIISGLVIDATKKTGNKLTKQIASIRKDIGETIFENFSQHVPEVSRARATELLQQHVLKSADLRSSTVYCDKERKSSQEFFGLSWSREKMLEARKEMQSLLLRRCKNSWSGNELNISTNAYRFDLTIDAKFPGVPGGYESGSICHPDDPNPRLNMHLNNFLHGMHFYSRTVLGEVQELLDSAWAMYETLEAHLAPVKSVDVLLKLMPEAAKHLPDSLKQPKAVKELADPTAINEIREKLKAGLPI